MKRHLLFVLLSVFFVLSAKAQIGYQVSLLNTATGEPRANVTVNATATITDSKGGVIYTGTQTVTSNDFGVLSLTVGNADTFRGVDFGKLPFFIEVSVDGKMIGKSQILNVPVAEAAKTLVADITQEELCSKEWLFFDRYGKHIYSFYRDMTGTRTEIYTDYEGIQRVDKFPFTYYQLGNFFRLRINYSSDNTESISLIYYNGKMEYF